MSDGFSEEISMLYLRGLSVSQIAAKLHCSAHKVTYWMHKIGMKSRSRSDAMYVRLNPDGDPFCIREIKTLEDAKLFGLGIGIYWGEGNKTSKHAVRVTNTDPQILLNFIHFLEVICGVRKQKISFSIVCFNDSDVAKVKNYWSKVFSVSGEKFGKIVQIPPQGKGTYKHKSINGVCTVSVHNIKLKKWIVETLRSFVPG